MFTFLEVFSEKKTRVSQRPVRYYRPLLLDRYGLMQCVDFGQSDPVPPLAPVRWLYMFLRAGEARVLIRRIWRRESILRDIDALRSRCQLSLFAIADPFES